MNQRVRLSLYPPERVLTISGNGTYAIRQDLKAANRLWLWNPVRREWYLDEPSPRDVSFVSSVCRQNQVELADYDITPTLLRDAKGGRPVVLRLKDGVLAASHAFPIKEALKTRSFMSWNEPDKTWRTRVYDPADVSAVAWACNFFGIGFVNAVPAPIEHQPAPEEEEMVVVQEVKDEVKDEEEEEESFAVCHWQPLQQGGCAAASTSTTGEQEVGGMAARSWAPRTPTGGPRRSHQVYQAAAVGPSRMAGNAAEGSGSRTPVPASSASASHTKASSSKRSASDKGSAAASQDTSGARGRHSRPKTQKRKPNPVVAVAIDIETTRGANFSELRPRSSSYESGDLLPPNNPVWKDYCVASVAICCLRKNGDTDEPETHLVTPWPNDPPVDNPYSGEIKPLKGRRDFGEKAHTVFSRLVEAVGDSTVTTILAHNAPFDSSVLVAHMARVGMDPAVIAGKQWFCTSKAGREINGRWTKLEVLASQMSVAVNPSRRHYAGYDAFLCAKVFAQIRDRLPYLIFSHSCNVILTGVPNRRQDLLMCTVCNCPCPAKPAAAGGGAVFCNAECEEAAAAAQSVAPPATPPPSSNTRSRTQAQEALARPPAAGTRSSH